MKRLFHKFKQSSSFDPMGVLNKSIIKPGNTTDDTIVGGGGSMVIANHQISKKHLIIFAAIFAAIGGLIIYRSFAAVNTINDSSVGTGLNQYEFVGSWTAGADAPAHGGDEHYSNGVGAYYQVRFSGTQVKVYTTVDPAHGKSAISIDGGAETEVDSYAATRAYNVLIYTSPTLTDGLHTLKVRVTGTKNAASANTYVVADKVEVTSTSTTTATTTSAGCPAGVSPAAFPSRLKASGRNLVDENGCVMPKLKGFNIHAATSPGSSWAWDNAQFQDISANGGRVLRTVVKWDAYESTQGVINEANLAGLDTHIARAQRNGMYVILDLHLNVGAIPSWATNGNDEMDKYINYGQKITQTLAQRYSVPRSADGITINPKTVLGFNLNEPPQDSTTINSDNSIPTFEAQQRQMVSWFRTAGEPDWIGFVSLAYANQKPYLSGTKKSADPHAYDSVGGNVVFDAHDYLVYNDSTDANTDSRQANGALADTRYFNPGAHWLAIQDPHNFPSDPTIATRAKSQMKAFLKPFDTYATAASMPLMVGEFGWNGDTTGGTGKSGYYAAKRDAMNCMNTAIEIHWIYATSYSQDQWSAKSAPSTWDPEVLSWLKDTNNTCSTTTTTPPPAPATTISLKLINADTDQTISAMSSGMTIDLKNARNLSIAALPSTSVGSVRFDYDGQVGYKTEGAAPYAIAGDNSPTDYIAWTPTVGTHTLTVKAFSSAGATGTEMASTTINFTVVDTGTTSTTPNPAGYELLWEDNFDGTMLNADSAGITDLSQKKSKWSTYNGPGHAGNGLRRASAFSLDGNGNLVITAKSVLQSDGTKKTVSGGMSNATNATYGRMETRVRVEPDPTGTMSGLVMTWPQAGNNCLNGELDFFETGHPLNTRAPFYSYLHYPTADQNCSPTPQKQFTHNYDGSKWKKVIMEWTPQYINIKVYDSPDGGPEVLLTDNTLTEDSTDKIPDVPHHMTIQLDAFSTTPLPDSVIVREYVDYVRHYKIVSAPNPADTTPPTVSISSPANNATVSGTITATANASDNAGVTGVQFKLDGTVVMDDTSAPYNYSFNSLNLSNGPHMIEAIARDAAGNVSTVANNPDSRIVVNVSNTDTVPPNAPTSLSGPTSTLTAPATVTLSWPAATDNGSPASGIKGYWVQRDGITILCQGQTVGQPLNALTCTDTNVQAKNTAYVYTVRSVDNVDLTSTAASPPVNVTVVSPTDTQAPSMPTSLSATTMSQSQINLSWAASSDNVGVVGYNVYRGTSPDSLNKINSNLVSSTTFGDSADLIANTTYHYQVEAVDGAGNVSSRSTTASARTAPLGINLKLINADTDQAISAMSNGMTIDLKNARNLNIDASASGMVESIQFNDNGQMLTENFPPYAIGGDSGTNSTDYYPWTPTVGSHTLTVKAFSADGATGTELASTTINFTVVDTTAAPVTVVEAENLALPSGVVVLNDAQASNSRAIRFYTNGTASLNSFSLNSAARKLIVRAKGAQCGGAPQMVVSIDGVKVQTASITSTSWADYSVDTPITSGAHTLSIAFTNDRSQYTGNSGKLKCSIDLDVDKVTFN